MHGRTQTRCVDLIFGNTRQHQLIAAGPCQVEPQPWPVSAGPCRWKGSAPRRKGAKPPIDQISRMTRGRERVDQLASNLVAARADARPYRNMDVGGPGPELVRQRFDRRTDRAGGDSSPTGMHRCNGARSSIGKEQRNAVGGANGQRGTGVIGDEHVTSGSIDGRTRSPSDDDDVTAVDLMRRDHLFGAKALGQAVPIVLR